jgi:hypothetical protein
VPQKHNRVQRLLLFAFLWIVFLPSPQAKSTQQPVPTPPETGGVIIEDDEATRRLSRDMAKKANEQRHLALKNDADKLLKLSVELKTYVDKSNENILSLDVLKKAEEIEKLAHSVKEKMRGSN